MMHVTWARFDREISWGLNEFELSMEHVMSGEKIEVRSGNDFGVCTFVRYREVCYPNIQACHRAHCSHGPPTSFTS